MHAADLLHRNELGDRAMFRFVGKVAEQVKTSTELVQAWEEVVAEAVAAGPPSRGRFATHLLHAYLFDRVIDIITPDLAIAGEAKEKLKLLEASRSQVDRARAQSE